MGRVIYTNGIWENYANAAIHVEDRGFQFADGIYETLGVQQSIIIDVQLHLRRLQYSLEQIKLDPQINFNVLPFLMKEAVKRNRISNGLVYLQITRGRAVRDHDFPPLAKSSLVIIARNISAKKITAQRAGVNVITQNDERWGRCDIKSTNLLANVLARQNAIEQGGQEAWLVNENGIITEGTASNAWIYKDNKLKTYQANQEILGGITRQSIFDIASQLNIEIDESGFNAKEAIEAHAAFVSSSIGGIIPVLSLDGVLVKQNERLITQLQTALEENIKEQIKVAN